MQGLEVLVQHESSFALRRLCGVYSKIMVRVINRVQYGAFDCREILSWIQKVHSKIRSSVEPQTGRLYEFL